MGAIMDIVVKVSRDILYEGGDINGTIPPPLLTRWLELTRAIVFIDNIDIERPGTSCIKWCLLTRAIT